VAPSSAKQIQLSLFNGKKQIYSKNFSNYPLTDGTARFLGLTGIPRGATITAQIQIFTPGTTKTQQYRADGVVFAAPALELRFPTGPAVVGAHHPASFSVTVAETKGDLGATFDAVLLRGTELLDFIPQVSVGPGGSVILLFSTTFHTTGSYDVTIKIQKVSPLEYGLPDLQTNLRGTIVDVPVESTPVSMIYENRIRSHATRVTDLTDGVITYDQGLDSIDEVFTYSTFWNAPVHEAGFSVYIVSDGKELMAKSIGRKAPPDREKVTDLGNGNFAHSIFYQIALNVDGTDYLRLDSSWQTDSGQNVSRSFTSLTMQHLAYDYVYFSAAAFFTDGTKVHTPDLPPNTRANTIWQIPAGKSIFADVRVLADDGKDYGGPASATVEYSEFPFTDVTTTEVDKNGHTIETRETDHTDIWRGQYPSQS
jgi:hypothetical protein